MTQTQRWPRKAWWWVISFPLLVLVGVVGSVLLSAQGGLHALHVPDEHAPAPVVTASLLERGEYLARIGGCIGCHTARGGVPLAGGEAFVSEFGTLYSSNLTPDTQNGIGDWTLAEFRHAMRHGVSRNGLLYPAFPFQNFQHLSDDDLAALFVWLQQQPADAHRVPENRLDFPAGWRPALLGWRMLFHRPQPLPEATTQSAIWQRGRDLVEGIGHCSMCHGQRGPYASLPLPLRLAGGMVPVSGWMAPALDRQSLARWTVPDLADYLRHGVAPQASAYGPMATVIRSGLQSLTPEDATAMATYLLELPPAPRLAAPAPMVLPSARQHVSVVSTALYETHCAECHGSDGQGKPRVYPPLAGNPQVMAMTPTNLIRVVLFGAAPPVTGGNPTPHTMPPFSHRLTEAELLSLLNHVRGSWGNDAPSVGSRQLQSVRALPLE